MNEMRIRPKSDYLKTASWDQLYVLTEHWKSNLDFYTDELRFLNKLVSKYFIWMTKEDNISNVQKMVVELKSLQKELEEVKTTVKKHMEHIGLFMENPFSHDEQKFRDEHVLLEDTIAEFVNSFKKAKREVFQITEHVIESEKLQHLLASA